MGVIATLFTIITLISSFIIYKITVDVTTLKMARKPVNIQKKLQQDALGKVNRGKEIRRREEDCLKITDNKHYMMKKVLRVVSVR